MSAKTKNLRPIQRLAVVALIASPSLADAAAQVGVCQPTLRRWRREPAFQAAERAAAEEWARETLAGLRSLARQAIATLQASMECDRPAVALRAAVQALKLTSRLSEHLSQEDRIAELERQAAEARKKR